MRLTLTVEEAPSLLGISRTLAYENEGSPTTSHPLLWPTNNIWTLTRSSCERRRFGRSVGALGAQERREGMTASVMVCR